jgi:hypothetical protein
MTDTKFSAAATGPMVTVEVGPDRKRFLIHKALLVHHSEYFAAATRGPWKDTQDGVVPLHDVEPTTCRRRDLPTVQKSSN